LLTALHLPGAGLAAAGALSPRAGHRLVRRGAAIGTAAGVATALASSQVSALLGLPVPYVLALAAAMPAAALLGLRRGIAYGNRDHSAVVISLIAEPAARLIAGLTLAIFAGAPGAAWGVSLGGWVALITLKDVR